jgi:hypothetical protein
MKLFCNLGWHNWETLNNEELRVDSFELFGKLHEDVCIGDILMQRCKKCGKTRDRAIYFSQREIVLHMLREVSDDLRRTNEKMKYNNKKLRESVGRMNEAVKSLKDY